MIRPKSRGLLGGFKGRSCEIEATGGLGLVLVWYRTRGPVTLTLSMIFGQSSIPLYKWLEFSRSVLLSVLIHHEDAMVRKPSDEKLALYFDAIKTKYYKLGNVWAALDGLKLSIQKPDLAIIENNFYNGWTHGNYVNCLFLFCPDGKIRASLVNAPDVFHDSSMADYGLYKIMKDIYAYSGGKVVFDSVFKLPAANYIIKSSQRDPEDLDNFFINRQETSIRKLSEWVMCMVQGALCYLKVEILYEEEGDRLIILKLMMNIYNFQCTKLGIKQILNSYMMKKKVISNTMALLQMQILYLKIKTNPD